MKSFTTYETILFVAGQEFEVFAEVDVTISRGGFDYGFGGQRQTEAEVEVEVTDFSARTPAGDVEDKALLRQIGDELDEAILSDHLQIVERATR